MYVDRCGESGPKKSFVQESQLTLFPDVAAWTRDAWFCSGAFIEKDHVYYIQ